MVLGRMCDFSKAGVLWIALIAVGGCFADASPAREIPAQREKPPLGLVRYWSIYYGPRYDIRGRNHLLTLNGDSTYEFATSAETTVTTMFESAKPKVRRYPTEHGRWRCMC